MSDVEVEAQTPITPDSEHSASSGLLKRFPRLPSFERPSLKLPTLSRPSLRLPAISRPSLRLPKLRRPNLRILPTIKALRKHIILTVFCIIFTWLAVDSFYKQVNPRSSWHTEAAKEEARWIATSDFWLDRVSCRWMGVCGWGHFRSDPAMRGGNKKPSSDDCAPDDNSCYELRSELRRRQVQDPMSLLKNKTTLKDVPQYVLDHAPVVHLYSGEFFWPSRIEDHLENVSPYLNFTALDKLEGGVTVDNLDHYNQFGDNGMFVFLTANDDIEQRPDWLWSGENIPLGSEIYEGPGIKPTPESSSFRFQGKDGLRYQDDQVWAQSGYVGVDGPGSLPQVRRRSRPRDEEQAFHAAQSAVHAPHPDGYSSAPVYLVMVPKPGGILDAFWFYFYSYNLGNNVLNLRFGNHVGDWEHTMVRFKDGMPTQVFLSAHEWGHSLEWDAIEKWDKDPKRPLTFSAEGSHAMYASAAKHNYIIPFGLLYDYTDHGPLWDPLLNMRSYFYDLDTYNLFKPMPSEGLTPTTANPDAPINWYHYSGRWGDKYYDLGDPRQYRIAGQYHYVGGPEGPKFKDLNRVHVCPFDKCHVAKTYEEATRRNWFGVGA